jgi:very-short-patch-repair endonuclease
MEKNSYNRSSTSPIAQGFPRGFDIPMLLHARYLKPYSRDLRTNATDAERALWHRLRRKQIEGVQFYRQKPLASYIVDFYAPAAHLVVEIDGSQHFTEQGRAADALRDATLVRMGLRVLRFDDRQVLLELEAVVGEIWRVVVGA